MQDQIDMKELNFHKESWIDAFTNKMKSILKGKSKSNAIMLNSIERYTTIVKGMDFVLYVYIDHVKKKKTVQYLRKVFEKEVPYAS